MFGWETTFAGNGGDLRILRRKSHPTIEQAILPTDRPKNVIGWASRHGATMGPGATRKGRMSTLVLELRPDEVMIINGAPIRFSTKSRVELTGKARFMFGKQIMPPDEADSPARRIYFALQTAYIGAEEERSGGLQSARELIAAFQEATTSVLARESLDRLSGAVVAELERYHKREPLARGMLRETLREKVFTHAVAELFNGVLARLETEGKVVSEKDIVRSSKHSVGLSEQDVQLSRRIEEVYLAAGVEAPSLDDAMTKANVPAAQRAQARKLLQLLLDERKLSRIHGEMFMHTNVVEDLKTKLQTYASHHEPDRLIDVPTFKDLAGVSRKYAIPLLEHFDREQVTRRAGDKRLILKPR